MASLSFSKVLRSQPKQSNPFKKGFTWSTVKDKGNTTIIKDRPLKPGRSRKGSLNQSEAPLNSSVGSKGVFLPVNPVRLSPWCCFRSMNLFSVCSCERFRKRRQEYLQCHPPPTKRIRPCKNPNSRGELQYKQRLWNLIFSEWNLYVEPCGT